MRVGALRERLARRAGRAWRARRGRRLAAGALAAALGGLLWARLGPLPPGLLDVADSTSTVVVDRHGVPLYEALSGEGTRSVKLTAATLPPTLIAATVAAEDRRFWSHPGIDPIAILRAAKANLAERRMAEGGSTISQQVAKLLLNRRSPRRTRGMAAKIREALIALRLEHRFSKREMLALYLNHAAYGNQVVGAERASRTYFGTSASMLTPAQSAFLAGLPQRPSGFNPYRYRDAGIARQRAVLRRMEQAGALTAGQARAARDERLAFARGAAPFRAPHFVDMVLSSIQPPRPERVDTTLDGRLQADVSGIIASHRALLTAHGAHNVAVVVLDNGTGEWLAWEGSGDYFDADHGGTIDGAVAPRQPGSALKPFTYALAFEEGHHPASVLADVPTHFPTADPGIVYSPRNYDGRYRGPLLARRALAGSENVPAVALASEVGVPALLRFFQRAGFTTFDRNAAYYGLGVTLGNAEVRLDQLVAAFAAFARGGEWIEPTWRPSGRSSGARARRQLVSRRAAFWITDILSDPEAREYVFGRGGSLEFPFPVAVKTGTSQAYHDNWTVGYSRHVTVGVWVGNFDRTPLRNSSGVTGAAPIFQAVMLAAERRAAGAAPDSGAVAIVAPPGTTKELEICGLSGLAANPWCPTRQREWVAAEAPPLPCSWHHLADEGLLTIYPPEYRTWADAAGLMPPPGSTRAAAAARRAPLPAVFAITTPPDGATYLIDPTLRREFQTLSLKTVAAAPGAVAWSMDGQPLGAAAEDEAVEWALVPGRHRITARDARGRVAEATIVVR